MRMIRTSIWMIVALTGTLLQPARATTEIVYSDKDTRITRGHSHRNDGLHTRLATQSWNNGHGKLKIVVNFPLSSLAGETVTSATLEFRNVVKPNYGNMAEHGVRRMLDTSWVEGNRKSDSNDCTPKVTGTGEGMTWRCFIDEDISNANGDCDPARQWDGAQMGTLPGDNFVASTYTETLVLVDDGDWENQIVSFDVTTDVVDALAAEDEDVGWMVERSNSGKGRVKLGSREWAAACQGDHDMGPRLVVEVQ